MKENIITVLSSVVLSVVASSIVVNANNKAPAVAPAPVVAQAPANIDSSVEAYIKANPKVIREAMEAAHRQEEQERQRRSEENYKNYLGELHNIENSPFIGPKDAKITIVEFFDFNCGYCKRVAPAMMKVAKNNPDVRIILKPVAFLSATSQTAAKALLAANEIDSKKFINFYEALLSSKNSITEDVIYDTVKEAGYNIEEIKKMMDGEVVNKKFNEIAELSRNVEVRGVPTLIINGSPLRAIDYDPIQNAINRLK
ncbi:MAG: DsbA family protein [Alphaproteobacteria bacterium]|nr:DsbA family protein [Alphaproteobacteria bacterium]